MKTAEEKSKAMKTKYGIYSVADEKEKTYDIVKIWSDGVKIRYRTTVLTAQEFEELEYNTSVDWQNFLNTSPDYYSLK